MEMKKGFLTKDDTRAYSVVYQSNGVTLNFDGKEIFFGKRDIENLQAFAFDILDGYRHLVSSKIEPESKLQVSSEGIVLYGNR